MKSSSSVPRWETAVMALSFVLLWAWFLARQASVRDGSSMHWAWTAVLLASVAALAVVFFRRMKRTLESLRSQAPSQRGSSRNSR